MIEKMTKYSFILLSGDQEKFITQLEDLGLMDITRATKPVDEKSAKLLDRAEEINKAIGKLKAIDYSNDTNYEEIKKIQVDTDIKDPVNKTFQELNILSDLEGSLDLAEREHLLIKVWGEFNKSAIKDFEEKGYKFRFYSINKKLWDNDWENQVALQIITEEKDNIYFITISDNPNYSFPINEIPAPTASVSESKHKMAILKEKIIQSKARLNSLLKFIPQLEENKKNKMHELDIYLAKIAAESEVENSISIFEGFAPTKNEKEVCNSLDKMEVYYVKEDAKTEDNPPIKLKSNWFTSMFTVLTDMYGRPVYNEFDPTPYLSIFFLLFFAMCMGDAGYGIVLVLIGIYLKKKKDFASMAPLVITLGVGTFIVGLIMHTFFGVDIAQLSWIPAWSKKYMITGKIAGFEAPMVLSIIIGIIHLSLAMVVKTIYATKNKGFLNSLSIWGWTLLIVGGVILGGLSIFQILPNVIIKWIIICIGIISAIGIFFLNDLHRNPLINIGAGLWETYNTATGLLGDVLSYLRLYALGLAGSMLAQAFNQIAMMTLGEGGFGIKPGLIAFLIIIILGHTLNIAMCCLGAFVHPLRLNFLEFFKNSAYEGKGRIYKPISK